MQRDATRVPAERRQLQVAQLGKPFKARKFLKNGRMEKWKNGKTSGPANKNKSSERDQWQALYRNNGIALQAFEGSSLRPFQYHLSERCLAEGCYSSWRTPHQPFQSTQVYY